MTKSQQATVRKALSDYETVQLNVMPTQWGSLRDIQDVEPLNPRDYACLAEVRDVLKKHGKNERFGVALLHKHFDMADDEILVEGTDQENRVLTIKPAPKNREIAAGGGTIETLWALKDGAPECMTECRTVCEYDNFSEHTGHRNHSN